MEKNYNIQVGMHVQNLNLENNPSAFLALDLLS